MAELAPEELTLQFRQLLDECRRLYVSSGQLCLREYPDLVPQSEAGFTKLMDDLHRALVVKVFVTICEADRQWSANERKLAQELVAHLWGGSLDSDQLKQVVQEMSAKAMSLKWYALVRPFDQIAPLRDRVGELETIVTRLAHLVARADGPVTRGELDCVKMIQDELYLHLRQIPIDEPDQHEQALEARVTAVKKMIRDAKAGAPEAVKKAAIANEEAREEISTKTPAERLKEALGELDQLVGLAGIKQEIRTLANFLKVQAQRKESGLPGTELSLHMVFSGNPGTGKTSVARIVGKIYGAMGVLKRGHLVETDRSGLVAGYAGQTSIKTNEKISESLDGILFIDEAYSLVAADSEDQYGHEAIQTLLKRMEDNRERLVVILAGYPAEMQKLLESNPGLSSRFSRNLEFPDYSPLELAQIFGAMCDKNHYILGPLTRAKISLGFDHAHRHRDRHFGNGRTARNVFEQAIRRMANRIVEIADLSPAQLSTLEPDDVEFPGITPEALSALGQQDTLRFQIRCAHCQHVKDVPQMFLGQSVRCPKCSKDFSASWGELVCAPEASRT